MSWVHRGMNRSTKQLTESSENCFAVHAICLSRATIHSPMNREKRHAFLKRRECKNETNLGVSTGLFMHTKLLFNVVPLTDHASFK